MNSGVHAQSQNGGYIRVKPTLSKLPNYLLGDLDMAEVWPNIQYDFHLDQIQTSHTGATCFWYVIQNIKTFCKQNN